MKKIIFALLMLFPIYVIAQNGPMIVNYEEIQKFVEEKPDDYNKLYERFVAADTTLTTKEAYLAYYGFTCTPKYNGYFHTSKNGIELYEQEKFDEAYSVFKASLEENPFSITTIIKTLVCAQHKSSPDTDMMNKCIFWYRLLNEVLVLSGDGSAKYPMCIITVEDEYEMLKGYFEASGFDGQALVYVDGHPCDCMSIKHEDGSQEKIYFDVSSVFASYKKLLEE